MGVLRWLAGPVGRAASTRSPLFDAIRGTAARVTTPLLPDDYLQLANPLWSARELRGRIVEVRRETEDSATLVVRPGWGFDFDYRPGQYVGIGVGVDGRWHWRSYSLTSVPRRNDKLISIAVKAMPDGFLSGHLVDGLPAGTVVRLAAPAGNFQLPEPPPRRVLFLTAGSGITPVIAMLRSLDRHREMPDVAHVHSAPRPRDVMFADELDDYSRRYHGEEPGEGRYRLHVRLTRSTGQFTPADLDETFPDWRTRETWACGPAALLDAIEVFWAANGLRDRLHTERFELSRADVSGRGGTVEFGASERSTTVDGATTLLEAGEAIGVRMPFGCRMGICQTCVVPLAAGHVTDLRSGRQHAAGELIQTCVCSPAGDCRLEL